MASGMRRLVRRRRDGMAAWPIAAWPFVGPAPAPGDDLRRARRRTGAAGGGAVRSRRAVSDRFSHGRISLFVGRGHGVSTPDSQRTNPVYRPRASLHKGLTAIVAGPALGGVAPAAPAGAGVRRPSPLTGARGTGVGSIVVSRPHSGDGGRRHRPRPPHAHVDAVARRLRGRRGRSAGAPPRSRHVELADPDVVVIDYKMPGIDGLDYRSRCGPPVRTR